MDKTIRWWLLKLFNMHIHDWTPWEVISKDKVVRGDKKDVIGHIIFMKRKCNSCLKVELTNSQTTL